VVAPLVVGTVLVSVLDEPPGTEVVGGTLDEAAAPSLVESPHETVSKARTRTTGIAVLDDRAEHPFTQATVRGPLNDRQGPRSLDDSDDGNHRGALPTCDWKGAAVLWSDISGYLSSLSASSSFGPPAPGRDSTGRT
jgi:hypothetical protein